MRDLALQAAGLLAIAVALGHGGLAEWKVFPNTRIEPPRARKLVRMVWQASTLDWIAIGVLLIAAPGFGSQSARSWVVGAAVVVFAYAGLGNFVVTRGPHPGWIGMGLAVALAFIGL